jgi:hypothetical protein
VRFSETALTYGVDSHTFEGAPVKITSAAKTVADVFKDVPWIVGDDGLRHGSRCELELVGIGTKKEIVVRAGVH